MATKPVQVFVRNGRVERGKLTPKGRPGYQWYEGYAEVTPAYRNADPYRRGVFCTCTKAECRFTAERDGCKAVFYDRIEDVPSLDASSEVSHV
jgi:hypothetical protein